MRSGRTSLYEPYTALTEALIAEGVREHPAETAEALDRWRARQDRPLGVPPCGAPSRPLPNERACALDLAERQYTLARSDAPDALCAEALAVADLLTRYAHTLRGDE